MSSRVQEIKIKCPFCKVGELTISYVPGSVRFKKGSWGGSRPGVIRSQEHSSIQEEKCPNCGKSKKEIQMKLDGEGEVSHEERLKRLRDSGLPTRVEE